MSGAERHPSLSSVKLTVVRVCFKKRCFLYLKVVSISSERINYLSWRGVHLKGMLAVINTCDYLTLVVTSEIRQETNV